MSDSKDLCNGDDFVVESSQCYLNMKHAKSLPQLDYNDMPVDNKIQTASRKFNVLMNEVK